MKLFASKKEAKNTPERIQRIETPALLSWFDNTIMSLGMGFDGWRYHGKGTTEVDEALEALNLIWYELKQRVDGSKKR
jgi:hypothetical protein